jgi:hypothetical protein
VTRSRAGLQLAAAVCCSVVGLVLAIGFRGFHGVREDAFAGFVLGVLLLLIGLAGLLFTGRQTITVDPRLRRIEVADTYLLMRRRSRIISFAAISSVNIGFLGKRSNYVRNYYVVLHLRDGKDYSLFAPGRFWEGASSRGTAEGWRQRLEAYLGAGPQLGGQLEMGLMGGYAAPPIG